MLLSSGEIAAHPSRLAHKPHVRNGDVVGHCLAHVVHGQPRYGRGCAIQAKAKVEAASISDQ